MHQTNTNNPVDFPTPMNPHFRELAEQAGLGTRWTNTQEFEQFLERFAELITQECLDAADVAQADFYVLESIRNRLGFNSENCY